MKKMLQLAAMAAISLVLGNASPARDQQEKAGVAAIHAAEQRRITYTWYYDPGFYSFTGSISTINAELTRLRSLYSGYTFSASPGTGLYEFEYGHHPNYVTAVIYSNY